MADQLGRLAPVTKGELVAQLDGARWQLSRECRDLSDDLGRKLNVKQQLRRSIKDRPSTWTLGLIGLGFLGLRLIFRKKNRAKDKKASYERRRSPVFKILMGHLLKTLFFAIEPQLASVLKERITTFSKSLNSHV